MDGKDDRYEWIKRDEKIPVWTFTEGNTNYYEVLILDYVFSFTLP